MKIGIIGGGASGILSAILLKKGNPNFDVTILEQNDRIGKKLLATGNGMCNLDNVHSSDCFYYNTNKIETVLKKYNYQVVLNIFEKLGLITTIDNEGRIYPYARKASNVLDILLVNLKCEGVNIKCGINVKQIEKSNQKYIVNREYSFDVLILACGGMASISGEYKGIGLAKSLGLKWADTLPSLSGLKLKESVKALSGIRMKAKVHYLWSDPNTKKVDLINSSYGEVLFKDDGISGIVILELSRFFNPVKQNKISLDLFPDYEENQLVQLIQNNYHKFINLADALIGLVPKMIALDLIKKGNNDIRKIAYLLKHFEFNVISPYDYSNSQVMRGGIDLDCLDLESFESKENKNLYCIGECINVDGSCGGFNLHFAWISAIASTCSILNK